VQPAIIIHYTKVTVLIWYFNDAATLNKAEDSSWLNLIIFQELNTQLYLLIIGIEHQDTFSWNENEIPIQISHSYKRVLLSANQYTT